MRHGLRGWGALAAFILILGFVWLLGHAAEPGKGQPPDKTRPPEQEETVRPKTKKLKDLDPDKVEEPAARPAETPASDLVQALRSVRNGKVKDLYEKLAVPYDRMVRANGHEEHIKPIQPLIQDSVQNLPPNMQIVPLVGADKKPGKPFERIPKLAKIVPYEEEALDGREEVPGSKAGNVGANRSVLPLATGSAGGGGGGAQRGGALSRLGHRIAGAIGPGLEPGARQAARRSSSTCCCCNFKS